MTNLISNDSSALNDLKAYPQWICHKNKEPYSREEYRVSPTDPKNHLDYKEAESICKSKGHTGLGFVLTDTNPFCCVDIDHCIDPESRELKPEAQKIVDALDTYVEYSPSGLGLHIWLKTSQPKLPRTRYELFGCPIEVYSTGRYITITGKHYPGTPTEIRKRGKRLSELLPAAKVQVPKTWTATTTQMLDQETYVGDELDVSILNILKKDKKYSELFDGSWESQYQSQSEAVFALLGRIACLTKDRGQLHIPKVRPVFW